MPETTPDEAGHSRPRNRLYASLEDNELAPSPTPRPRLPRFALVISVCLFTLLLLQTQVDFDKAGVFSSVHFFARHFSAPGVYVVPS